jgi:protoheme IX farnesyltransferase
VTSPTTGGTAEHASAGQRSHHSSTGRLPELLAATAVGVYLLILVGATAALSDAAAACSTWPTCPVPGGDAGLDAGLLTAWTHRLATVVVGATLLGTAVLAIRRRVRRQVLLPVLLAVALYPVQIAIGALTATGGAPTLLAGVHLAVGMAIFGGLVVALAWAFADDDPADATDDRLAEDGSTVTTTADVAAEAAAAPTAESPPNAAEPTVAAGAFEEWTLRDKLSAYVELTKPRLMWLLCLVAAAAMALAAGPALGLGLLGKTMLGGVLAIGASGTFNNVFERDVDRYMERTADRPVATYRVPVRNALAFGIALALAAVGVFLTINVLTAALGLVAIAFYSVVYTLVLKPNTDQNTVIGGFAGALPAFIGWAAVTGNIGLPAILLAGVIFLWTPAHFYNLALAYREDYARAGFPMLPVVRGEATTHRHILYYLAATFLATATLAALTTLGWPTALASAVFGAVFLWMVLRLQRERTEAAAMRAFHASNAYLGAILVAVVVDAMVV